MENYLENAKSFETYINNLLTTIKKGRRKERRDAQRKYKKLKENILNLVKPNLLEEILTISGKKGFVLKSFDYLLEKASSNYKNSLKFSRVYKKGILNPENISKPEKIEPFLGVLYALMTKSPENKFYYRKWLENLVDISQDKDFSEEEREEASNFIDMILKMFKAHDVNIISVPFYNFSEEHTRINKEFDNVSNEQNIFIWKIGDKLDEKEKINNTFNKLAKIYKKANEDVKYHNEALIKLSKMCQDNLENILNNSEQMWHEIVTEPRAAVKSGARDKVKIKIDALNYTGFRSFAFVREGYTFPNVGIELYYKIFGEDLVSTFNLEDGILKNINPTWPKWLEFTLNFIIIDSYHGITTGEFTPEIKYETRKTKTAYEKIPRLGYTIVREHLRKLVNNMKASEQAKELAKASTWLTTLPEGYTFVGEYARGLPSFPDQDKLTRHLKLKPLLIYDEDRLIQKITNI